MSEGSRHRDPGASVRSSSFSLSSLGSWACWKHKLKLELQTLSNPTLIVLTLLASLPGCVTPVERAAHQRQQEAAAKDLFDQTTKLYHLPSAQAQGQEREKLLAQAADGYRQLLRRYPDQPHWCAQALRSLGNVRAEQGKLDEAVRLYSRVEKEYPREEWEVLQAWKSAADLLWDAGQRDRAVVFYQKIVQRFDGSEQPAIVQTIVRASKRRLSAGSGE